MTVKMTHPNIPGSEFDSPDSAVPFHRAAGWVPVDEVDDEQVEVQGDEQNPVTQQEGPVPDGAAEDPAPKGRRANKKDGD